jgi:hypothetical protein
MFWKRKPEDKPQDKQFKELDDRIRGGGRSGGMRDELPEV